MNLPEFSGLTASPVKCMIVADALSLGATRCQTFSGDHTVIKELVEATTQLKEPAGSSDKWPTWGGAPCLFRLVQELFL